MTLSVIIATLGRPKCLKRCLTHLQQQTPPVSQIIVVDGDPERTAEPVAREFPEVIYVHNANGFGRMTASRNLGLDHSTGNVVAYVDDDAYAAPEWAANLMLPYADANIGAVGGQVLIGMPGESTILDAVGKITAWGEVIGNFGADIPGVIDVDHLMGCNMSFRRDLLAQLGGFSEFYPNGRCSTYEEVDLCLRIAALGRRVVFTAGASLLHEGAPRRVGARGNVNYIFGATRNLTTVLVRNRGLLYLPAFIALSVWRAFSTLSRDLLRAFARFVAPFAGIAVALLSIGRRQSRREVPATPATRKESCDNDHDRKPLLISLLRDKRNQGIEVEP